MRHIFLQSLCWHIVIFSSYSMFCHWFQPPRRSGSFLEKTFYHVYYVYYVSHIQWLEIADVLKCISSDNRISIRLYAQSFYSDNRIRIGIYIELFQFCFRFVFMSFVILYRFSLLLQSAPYSFSYALQSYPFFNFIDGLEREWEMRPGE